MKTIIYNPLDEFYKSTIGAVKENTEVVFRVKTAISVFFVYEKDSDKTILSIPMTCKGDYYECTVKFECGLYFYYFAVADGRFIVPSEDNAKLCDWCSGRFQLSVYSCDYTVPSFLQGGIIYQIFPDRFNSSKKNLSNYSGRVIHADLHDTPFFVPDKNGKVKNEDFFGGDLEGITQKLPYLKELGVTAIYLNPIFEAHSNHRYDTGDYFKIDRFLGSEEDLKTLIEEAKKYGIGIILDGVFNHTGDDSIYFNKYGRYGSVGAYQSKQSPYYKWYKFICYPNVYESWWGVNILPATNKDSEGFINFIAGNGGVLEHYLNLGICGWRLDVVDELPDLFVKKIRECVKRVNQDAIIIGEVWEDATNKISYGVRREYFLGAELDSVMNYPLKDAIIDYVNSGQGKRLFATVKEQIDHYPKMALDSLMNVLSTHDTFRLLSALSGIDMTGKSKAEAEKMLLEGKELKVAIERLKIAVLLQYTLYGVPSIYYGDEIGMQGYFDPLNRKYFEWDNINAEIHDFYIKMGKIRKEFACFIDGGVELIFADGGYFAFKRRSKGREIMVVTNLEENGIHLYFDGKLFDLISQKTFDREVFLRKGEYAVLINKI